MNIAKEQIMATFGVSQTFARNMKRNGCTTPEEYRVLRKMWKKKLKIEGKQKRKRALEGRKAKSAKPFKKHKK